VVYDPCNPVPGTNIPSGLPPVTHHKYAVHHVVGRIRHTLHHKYVHTGPTGGGAPNPYGCEKHAVAGPGYGKNAALPTTPFPSAPVSKLAALGGGLVGFGGLGGLIGGFGGGGGGRTVVTKVPLTPPGTNPVIPVVTPPVTVTTPPITPITPGPPTVGTSPPGTNPVPVPEPASVVIFMMAILAALAARYMMTRRRVAVVALSS
jgi:hypothetical protein